MLKLSTLYRPISASAVIGIILFGLQISLSTNKYNHSCFFLTSHNWALIEAGSNYILKLILNKFCKVLKDRKAMQLDARRIGSKLVLTFLQNEGSLLVAWFSIGVSDEET